jgi:hypothetical protein
MVVARIVIGKGIKSNIFEISFNPNTNPTVLRSEGRMFRNMIMNRKGDIHVHTHICVYAGLVECIKLFIRLVAIRRCLVVQYVHCIS